MVYVPQSSVAFAKSVPDDDDDIYSGFDNVPAALDSKTLQQDETLQEALRTTAIGKRMPSRSGVFRQGIGLGRIGTGQLGTARLGTGHPGTGRLVTGRIGTGVPGNAPRPMTAVRAAGYSSSPQIKQSAPPLHQPKEDNIEENVKQMEAKIMMLVEESSSLRISPHINSADGANSSTYDPAKSLAKAQEASGLERQLIRLQDQAGVSDSHNLDITFSVVLNLSCAYERAGLGGEALQALAALTRGSGSNSGIGNTGGSSLLPGRAMACPRLNAANIHFAHGEHRRALKLFRMALDRTPSAEKDLKLKIMHNIGLLLVRMGKFRDAVTNYQHMMHEGPDFKTGLHLVLCQVALSDIDGAKAAFQSLIEVEMEEDFEEKFGISEDKETEAMVFADVIRADKLSSWIQTERANAARCVLRAAHAISLNDPNGVEWCAEALRGSPCALLVGTLEAAGAHVALQGGRAVPARQALRRLATRPDRALRALAHANLAFMALVEGDVVSAGELSEQACSEGAGGPDAAALVTRALCEGRSQRWRGARALLREACLASPSARDPVYNLGLACERLGERQEAMTCYERASRAVPSDPCARVRLAACARAMGNVDAAAHWYHQVLADVPSDPSVLIEMAHMYEESGDLSMAQQCYMDADAIFPGNLEILGWLGSHARSSGDPIGALEYYKRASVLSPGHVQWGLEEGACLRAAGRYQEALVTYKKLRERFPDNIECLKVIVKLCGDQGLRETEKWAAELQRVQRQHNMSMHTSSGSPMTIGSGGSSRGSFSPPGTAPNGTVQANKGNLSAVSRKSGQWNGISNAPYASPPPPSVNSGNSLRRMITSSGKKQSEDEDELPLPPE